MTAALTATWAFAAAIVLAPQGQPAVGEGQVAVALHVHSTASSGELTLDELVELARSEGVEAIALSENLALEFRYAPLPFRWLTELRRSLPSLSEYGIDRHLAELRDARSRHPDVPLLAGVEVVPHYHWSGSIWTGNPTLHDMQRNVLVFPDPAETAADEGAARLFRRLPAIGNPGAASLGPGTLLRLLPGLAATWLGVRQLRRRRRTQPRRASTPGRRGRAATPPRRGRASTPEGRGRRSTLGRVTAIGATAIGLTLLVLNFPYRVPLYSPYEDRGTEPHQRLFDWVDGRGGLSFWSMPQAVDYRDRFVGPITVRLSTDPYPDAIEQTTAHAGFGGVYADTVTMLEPGAHWDRTLLAYGRGSRPRPPWVVGETAFHYTGQAGKHLGDVLTVALTNERAPGAIFEALAEGRTYALRKDRGPALRLAAFRAEAGGGTSAVSGQTLDLPDGAPLTLSLEIEAPSREALPLRVRLVRQGVLHRSWEETTPFRQRLTDSLSPDEPLIYYRVVVDGPRPLRLVTNPIFVRRR